MVRMYCTMGHTPNITTGSVRTFVHTADILSINTENNLYMLHNDDVFSLSNNSIVKSCFIVHRLTPVGENTQKAVHEIFQWPINKET